MASDPLTRFEDHIQHLVEGGFARLFAGRLHPREVAVRLARAMEDHTQEMDGSRHAPDVYLVRLHSQDHEAILRDHPELAHALADELVALAGIANLKLETFPQVKILADDGVPPRQVMVAARHSAARADSTQGLKKSEFLQEVDAPKATLILNGEQHIPIHAPIVNIGRQHDNHIILDDPRISRHHAQIRLRFGQYMLFDLGSRVGTRVNDQPVQEAVLNSGDVIALADARLIYVEEDSGEPDAQERTKPYSPQPE